MVELYYYKNLLFCELDCKLNDNCINLKKVLIDTGSATTLINADHILLDGSEIRDTAYGVGGYEAILQKHLDVFKVNGFDIDDFDISLGNMDYGIDIDLLIGLDVLKALNADINLKDMKLSFN